MESTLYGQKNSLPFHSEGKIKIEGIFDECKLYNTSLNEIVWPRLIERRYLIFCIKLVS